MAANPVPFPSRQATPNTVKFTVRKSGLQTIVGNRATFAHPFRVVRVEFVVKQVGIRPGARSIRFPRFKQGYHRVRSSQTCVPT